MVNIKINGKEVQVAEGLSVLEACKGIGIKIPSLCYHPDVNAWASCGICVVKMENNGKMIRACSTKVYEGLSIITHDPQINRARRTVLELILSNHPQDCLQCVRNGNCELQDLAAEFGLRENRFEHFLKNQPVDDSNGSIVFDRDKCINCGRCVQVCQEVQNVWAIDFQGRGGKTIIGPAAGMLLNDSPCIRCGQCAAHCPTGAIHEFSNFAPLWEKIYDPDVVTAVQIAPSVRVALGEEFGMEPGELSTGKIYAALRRIGFDYIFDSNFSADLTIMEEGTEFVGRLTKGQGKIPLFTSCCPAWVDYAEKNYPDMLDNVSTAKSPQQMMGSVIKTYWAQKMGINPEKVYSVSIMPCTAKKYEVHRDSNMSASGYQDVDISFTTRELAKLIKQAGIDFTALEDEKADSPLGEYTGAGTIFGATGGVMEAAVRTAYKVITGSEMADLNLTPVRGLDGVKSAKLDIAGTEVRVAVVHQLGNVAKVMDAVREAAARGEEPPYHFIEVMACRGGCVGGGGQPYGTTDGVRTKRAKGLYKEDEASVKRCSHDNEEVAAVYKEFFGEPNSEKAHHLLHTHYQERAMYK